MDDSRNVTDEFKGRPHDDIVAALDARGVELEIAIENLERDFNMGTIVRSANAFGVRRVHIIGRRQWNKRGAMMTDKYLEVVYHASVSDFVEFTKNKGTLKSTPTKGSHPLVGGRRVIVAVDNVERSVDIRAIDKSEQAILVFGAEGPGLSDEMLAVCDQIVAIPQLGSTRSLNVGVAAGIAMWEWLR